MNTDAFFGAEMSVSPRFAAGVDSRKKIFFLYGAGGHAKVILDILRACGNAVDCICDDFATEREFCGVPVVNGKDAPAGTAIVSIGNNEARRRIVAFLRARGNVDFATAIHPSAIVSPTAKIGAGTVVMPSAIINAGAHIGEHCIVNTGASIDHDCVLGDFVHVSPHATLCGGVSVGAGTWIGAGTTVIQRVSVGEDSLVGAGSVVAKTIPPHAFACGNRCKVLKFIPPPPQFGNEVIFLGVLGGGDVHVSARERGARSVASPRLRSMGVAFPTLTRGVRNISRLRRLKRPRSGRTDANRRASAFPRESCGKLRENFRLRRRRTSRERPTLRAVRLLSETSFCFFAFPQDAMLRIVAPRLSEIRPLRGRSTLHFCHRQKYKCGDVDVSAPKDFFLRKKCKETSLPRSGNQQARSADSTPQYFNFFCVFAGTERRLAA